MTTQEYKDEINKIEVERSRKIRELIEVCAFSNNKVNVGDIFKDHIGYVRVEKIRATLSSIGEPTCIYFGACLKTNFAPFKSGEKRDAYQCNAVVF